MLCAEISKIFVGNSKFSMWNETAAWGRIQNAPYRICENLHAEFKQWGGNSKFPIWNEIAGWGGIQKFPCRIFKNLCVEFK
jgi:hypothetical protein